MDKHYTPVDMAARLVEEINKRPKVIADFAAGEGALLDAAQKKWPSARMVATDIDQHAVHLLAGRKNYGVKRCNFLSRRSRNNCSILRGQFSGADVILLNPPFSCRGSINHEVEFNGRLVRCSTAMAFLLSALQYLRPDGVLGAILPASCMSSEKDKIARNAISDEFQLEWKRSTSSADFSGCSVSVVFAFVKSGSGERRIPHRALAMVGKEEFHAQLSRGVLPVNEAVGQIAKSGLDFVHTTSLQGGKLLPSIKVATRRSIIAGPAIFIPRVGRFSIEKVCLKSSSEPAVISDCVFALQTPSLPTLIKLHRHLVSCAKYLEFAYAGSCAQYTTIERISEALRNLNVIVERCAVKTDLVTQVDDLRRRARG